MEYVYKYENDVGSVVYVGITNDMSRRISQHKRDKLATIQRPTVYYFPVSTRADAEMLETYLIDFYKTGQHYNVSKTKKGDFTFLDICDLLPWVKWDGTQCNDETPFILSSLMDKTNIREVVVEKKIYIDTSKSLSAVIDKFHNDLIEANNAMNERIEYEETVITFLQEARRRQPKNNVIREGLNLHVKCRKCLRIWKMLEKKDPIFYSTYREKQKLLLTIWTAHENNLRRFENILAKQANMPETAMPLL